MLKNNINEFAKALLGDKKIIDLTFVQYELFKYIIQLVILENKYSLSSASELIESMEYRRTVTIDIRDFIESNNFNIPPISMYLADDFEVLKNLGIEYTSKFCGTDEIRQSGAFIKGLVITSDVVRVILNADFVEIIINSKTFEKAQEEARRK